MAYQPSEQGGGFHISKLNKLKVIHDLYSKCLAHASSKTTLFFSMEGVYITYHGMTGTSQWAADKIKAHLFRVCLYIQC